MSGTNTLQRKPTDRITFEVSDVPEDALLPSVKTQDAVATLLGQRIEAACDYTDDCLDKVWHNPRWGCS